MSASEGDAPGSRGGPESIQVTVRSASESRDFTVSGDCTVTQLKRGLGERLGASEEQLVLVHGGRVLAEPELMSHLKGHSESVCLRLIQRPPRSSSLPAVDLASVRVQSELDAALQPDADVLSPSPTSPLCLVEGLNALGLEDSGPGFLLDSLQHQMESQLLADPQMLRRVLGSAFVQDTLSTSSPQLTRRLILSNPQIQQLMQTTPEVEEMLNNNDIITQVLELIRNPDMLDDVIRTEGSALDGFQPEQPNLETPADDAESQRTPGAKTGEHRLRLSQNHIGEHRVGTSCGNQQTAEGGSDPTPASPRQSTDPLRGFTSTTQPNAQFAVTAGMQSLLDEITASPGLIETLLSGPSVRSLLNCLSQNPDLAAQMLLSHPLFSENPQLQQQMRQQIPLFLQQMQSPELLSAMLNPRALEALLQIQQGLQTLATEAPALIPAAGLGHIGSDVDDNAPQRSSQPVLSSQSGGGPQVATVTEQQKQFVQQMLQTLANSSEGVPHEEL